MRWMRNFVGRVRREPAFAVIFIITLALGVGANAALFSALRGYFLAPLPYPDAGRLIAIGQGTEGENSTGSISHAIYHYFRHNAKSIVSGSLIDDAGGILRIGQGLAHKVRLGAVSGPWFKTLDVSPMLGHGFDPKAYRPGGPQQVMLSYDFWQHAMHGNPDIVGTTVSINNHPHTVVGVMPKGFYFGSRRVKFWTASRINPKSFAPGNALSTTNGVFVARLKPGVSLQEARQELNVLAYRQLDKVSANTQRNAHAHHYHIIVQSLRTSLMGSAGTRLLLIELGAGLLLLLTTAILANLVTVRTLARRHEAALRITLGASRFDLWRSALKQTLPLGLIGGALAVGLAWWGTTLIARYGIGTSDTAFSIVPDIWVVLFSLALGLVVGAVAALPAAFSSHKHLLSRLSEGGRGGIGRRARFAQRGLTIVQIALGVALIVNAGLLGVAFQRLSSHPTGMTTEHLIIADMGLHGPHFGNQKKQLNFYREFGNKMRTLPGLEHAGIASDLPFGGGWDGYGGVVGVGGVKTRNGHPIIEFVDGHALGALGVKLVHGRLIDAHDVHAKLPVAVVTTDLARRLFGTGDVVGREIKVNKTYRVVGVIKPLLWRAWPGVQVSGTMWMPYTVAPADPEFYAGPSMDIAVRSPLPAHVVRRELEGLLHKLAPNQAFGFVQSMKSLQRAAYHGNQALPVLFGLFSLLALVLAGVGTYGTVAYLIRLRLGEFAVRQALGATPGRVGLLALMQGAVIAAFGILLGIVAGFLLARALAGLIADTGGASVFAYVIAAAVMALAALGATAIPALRARRADLTSLLRPQ